MSKIDEIKKLNKLRERWVHNPPDNSVITDIISDIEYFRENTHVDFPHVNTFYFSDGEFPDTFFEDAHDDLWAYLENKEDDLQMFKNAMEHLENGINHLIEKLNED